MKNKKETRHLIRLAVASTDGKTVNCHFGKATRFYLLDVEPLTGKYSVAGFIPVHPFSESRAPEDTEKRQVEIRKLAGCRYCLAQQFGASAKIHLREADIIPVEIAGSIRDVVDFFSRRLQLSYYIDRKLSGKKEPGNEAGSGAIRKNDSTL